jgi:hypothetical protein
MWVESLSVMCIATNQRVAGVYATAFLCALGLHGRLQAETAQETSDAAAEALATVKASADAHSSTVCDR